MGRGGARLGTPTTSTTPFAELPPGILAKILLESTPVDNLLLHVSVCARVHPSWRAIVLRSPAYTVRLPFRKEVVMPWVSAALAAKERESLALGCTSAGYESNPAYRGHSTEQPRVRRPAPPTGLVAAPDSSEGNLPLGDGGALALGAALQAMPSPLPFQSIHLFKNFLTSEGLEPVMRAIRQRGCPRLTYLSVRHNPLGDAGISMLAAALPPSIRELYVGRTDCGDAGMIDLAAALPSTELEELHCVDLPLVGRAGWGALGKTLPQLPCLKLLNLTMNPGVSPLSCTVAATLPQAVRFERLLLDDCNVEDECVLALAKMLPQCGKLRFVSIAGNNFSAEAEASLTGRLAPRPEVMLQT